MEEFSYKRIERGYDRKSVDRILDPVFKLTNEPVRELEKVFSVDGSGPTSINQNSQDRKRQNAKRSKGKDSLSKTGKDAVPKDSWPTSTFTKYDYVYKVAIIGTRYKLFAGWKSTVDHTIGETTIFPEVMVQAVENHPNMDKILGDGIFATRPICKMVGKYGVIPRFLPRRNITLKRKGVKEWVDMLWDLAENPQEWLYDYHMRSLSESGFSMLVRTNPQP